MSDSYLRYIPSEPTLLPERAAASDAEAFLRSVLPDAEMIESRFLDEIQFVDAGGNWEGVSCPSCGNDAESWWYDAMSDAAETHFASLELKAPCCGASVSLNEMAYPWQVGFARYIAEAANPNCAGLSRSQLNELGAILSCTVREIKVHL